MQLNRFQRQSRIGSTRRSISSPKASTSATLSASSLNQWASNKGISLDKVQVEDSMIAMQNLSLIASRDIPAGETVLTVPESAFISPSAASKHPLLSPLTSSKGQQALAVDNWILLALLLIVERHSPSKGEWASYAQSLPDPSSLSSSTHPLFWSDELLDELQGTQLLASIGAYISFFASSYESVKKAIASSGGACTQLESLLTPERFLWAAAMIRARVPPSLEGEQLALVPILDLTKHSRSPNSKINITSSGIAFFGGKSKTASLEVTRAIRKGESISVDFGPGKIDSSILLDQGSIDTSNSRAGYSLSLSLDSNDRNVDDKADILELNGFPGSGCRISFRIGEDASEPVGSDMLAFLRLTNLNGADTFLLESVFRSDVWGHMNQPVSEGNERAVCRSMIDGAKSSLASYKTTIDQDLLLLRSGSVVKGSPMEAALLIRLGEKEALDMTLRWFEEKDALLPTLEYYQERRLKRLGLMDDKGKTTYEGLINSGIA